MLHIFKAGGHCRRKTSMNNFCDSMEVKTGPGERRRRPLTTGSSTNISWHLTLEYYQRQKEVVVGTVGIQIRTSCFLGVFLAALKYKTGESQSDDCTPHMLYCKSYFDYIRQQQQQHTPLFSDKTTFFPTHRNHTQLTTHSAITILLPYTLSWNSQHDEPHSHLDLGFRVLRNCRPSRPSLAFDQAPRLPALLVQDRQEQLCQGRISWDRYCQMDF